MGFTQYYFKKNFLYQAENSGLKMCSNIHEKCCVTEAAVGFVNSCNDVEERNFYSPEVMNAWSCRSTATSVYVFMSRHTLRYKHKFLLFPLNIILQCPCKLSKIPMETDSWVFRKRYLPYFVKQDRITINIQAFCDMTPCRLVNSFRYFKEACRINHQNLSRISTIYLCTLFQYK
jgi:hypothetical protein